jgi:LCP family protein required for cell wall assembly
MSTMSTGRRPRTPDDRRSPVKAADGRPSQGLHVSRTVAERQRRSPLWARLMVTVGVILLTLSGGMLLGGRYLLDRYSRGLHLENLLGDAGTRGSIEGPINVLLVGLDERPGDTADGSRADSIIIMHVTASHDQAYLVSVPRDSLVTIPAYPKTGYPGGQDKVNAAFQYGFQNAGGRAGGFELLAMTVKQLTGLSFNGGAIVNFAGFESLVTTLGGVDMCVDETVISVHVGTDADGRSQAPYDITDSGPTPVPGVKPQVYQPGCQHLAAWQALDYVRQRELIPDGDYGRQRHQQQFLQAILKRATGSGVMSNPVKLDAVLRAAGPALTFDRGGVPIETWLFALNRVRANRTVLIRTNGGAFNTMDVNGQSMEVLSDLSLKLFQHVRRDEVGAFVTANPEWVAANDRP